MRLSCPLFKATPHVSFILQEGHLELFVGQLGQGDPHARHCACRQKAIARALQLQLRHVATTGDNPRSRPAVLLAAWKLQYRRQRGPGSAAALANLVTFALFLCYADARTQPTQTQIDTHTHNTQTHQRAFPVPCLSRVGSILLAARGVAHESQEERYGNAP